VNNRSGTSAFRQPPPSDDIIGIDPDLILASAKMMHDRGHWIIPIRARGEPVKKPNPEHRTDPAEPEFITVAAKGKEPIGFDWGARRGRWRDVEREIRKVPGRGYGLGMGPGRAPEGRWLADFEVDGPQGEASLRTLLGVLGDDTFKTTAWMSRRGPHCLFTVDGPRLVDGLVKSGARGKKGEPGVFHHEALPGLEIRIGGPGKDGKDRQIQSVGPPSIGEDGQPREWLCRLMPAELPAQSYEWWESLALARYGQVALESEAAQFAAKPPGERHPTLLPATMRMQSLVKRGALTEGQVSAALGAAAVANGLVAEGRGGEVAESMETAGPKVEARKIGQAPGPADNGPPPVGGGPAQAPPASPGPDIFEADDDPHRLARVFVQRHGTHTGKLAICFWRGQYYLWDGCYRPIEPTELHARLARSCKEEFDRINRREVVAWRLRGGSLGDPPLALPVSKQLLGSVAQNLGGIALVAATIESPGWLRPDPPHPAHEILPASNGLLHLPTYLETGSGLLPSTPEFFSTYALEYAFDPDAPVPQAWIDFLVSLWPKDTQSIDTLQEWFGYCLTPDTSREKMLTLIGPKRSGKGTIAKVLTALVGKSNVEGPTLTRFANEFGLAGLIGKPLAIIPDARISGKTDRAAAVERLLAITGEDSISIPRKFLPDWSGKLPTRLMLLSNVLPELPDPAGALASRQIILSLTRSFYGKEDLGLYQRLAGVLPGILLWAIEGWRRLQERGHFLQPETGKELVTAMEHLASPVGAFVAERCEIDVGHEIKCKELYAEWLLWCDERRIKPSPEGIFGRDLHAVVPQIVTSYTERSEATGPWKGRLYKGIRVKEEVPPAPPY
jgi:putative DNA primase/helicase